MLGSTYFRSAMKTWMSWKKNPVFKLIWKIVFKDNWICKTIWEASLNDEEVEAEEELFRDFVEDGGFQSCEN